MRVPSISFKLTEWSIKEKKHEQWNSKIYIATYSLVQQFQMNHQPFEYYSWLLLLL